MFHNSNNPISIQPSHLIHLLILTLTITTLTTSISIPITTQDPRCMVVYSSSAQENIKIDLRFPHFPKEQQHDEYFVVWINNTESFQADFYRVEPGEIFRRELTLEPKDIMYKVCFRVNSTSGRNIGPVDVEYEAYHQFRIMNHDRHNIKIPDSILKENDLKNCYDDSLFLLDMTERQLQLNKMHEKDELRHFNVINTTTENLMLISAVEIGFIVLVAVVQFFVIRKHLAGEMRL